MDFLLCFIGAIGKVFTDNIKHHLEWSYALVIN